MSYKYYRDATNNVYAYAADGSQDAYVKPDLVSITEEERDALLNPPVDFATKVGNLQRAVDITYQNRMQAIADSYPAYERESWSIQLSEANAFKTDASSPTPWLDSCVAARQIDKGELVTRILAKDAAYRHVSGTLTGIRQRHEDTIALLTEENVDAYDVTLWWPSDEEDEEGVDPTPIIEDPVAPTE